MKKKTTKKKNQFRNSYPEDFKRQAIELAKELGLQKAVDKLGRPGLQTLATNGFGTTGKWRRTRNIAPLRN